MFLESNYFFIYFFIVYGTPQSQRLLVCPFKKIKYTPSAAHRKTQPNFALGSLGQARLFQFQPSTPILSSLLKNNKKSSILSCSTKLGKNKNKTNNFLIFSQLIEMTYYN